VAGLLFDILQGLLAAGLVGTADSGFALGMPGGRGGFALSQRCFCLRGVGGRLFSLLGQGRFPVPTLPLGLEAKLVIELVRSRGQIAHRVFETVQQSDDGRCSEVLIHSRS